MFILAKILSFTAMMINRIAVQLKTKNKVRAYFAGIFDLFVISSTDGEVLWISQMFVEEYRKYGIFFKLIEKLK